MPVVIVRHGERSDYADATWVDTQRKNDGRHWDPPLTSVGKLQAKACGERLANFPSDHGVPVPTRVYSSPFTRCVETAEGIATACGVGSIGIEDGLAEDLCEDWFRAWALSDSDGSWRGPTEKRGKPIDTDTLDSKAFQDCNTLLHDAHDLRATVSPLVDVDYHSVASVRDKGVCWGKFETREQLVERALLALNTLHQKYPNETIVLVTHGGPLMLLYDALKVEGSSKAPHAGYTAVALLVPNTTGDGWTFPIAVENSHVPSKLRSTSDSIEAGKQK